MSNKPEEEKHFECEVCTELFNTKDKLIVHLRRNEIKIEHRKLHHWCHHIQTNILRGRNEIKIEPTLESDYDKNCIPELFVIRNLELTRNKIFFSLL